MVNRAALLIVVLSVIFVALGAFLLHLQLPPDTALTDLLCAGDSLPLLLVQSYTLPRISIALLAGGGLAFAALLLQQVMSNPLASDNTLGISGGAQFGLFLSAIFAPQLLEYGSGLIALLGTSLSLLLVMSLSLRKTMSPLLLILAGLVVNLYLGAFTSMMMLFYPEESRGLAQWGAGSLVQESWRDSQWLLAQSAVGFCLVFSFIRPLTILTLNDSNAQSLGVPVGKLRLFAVIVSAYLIAAVVSAVGMLGFIGLAAATIVRQLGVRTLAWQLISAFLVGALLLAITDLLLQLLNFYTQLSFPTGAVTALLGTPLLLWLMFRALPHSGRLTGEERKKQRRFRPHFTWLLIILFAVSLWLALNVGKSAFDQWSVLDFNHPFAPEILNLRYPRILIALCAGILLSVAGVLLQRLTLNPMASPELLGVSSGASMGILLLLFVFSAQQPLWFWLAGIGGALVALLILSAINRHNGMLPEKVLLTGISLSALFNTLQRIAIASGDPRANQLIAWT
ncbi:iron ABC transporter permease, partial [Haemophilus influenzae]